MPVLTAYAPHPIHSAGWASMHPDAPFLSKTSSRFGSVVSRGSPLVRNRQKRCKSQLEKMNKSMAVSVQPSKKNKLKKRSAAIESSTHEVTSVPVIKGILIKPSSLLHLYQSNSPLTGSEIELVAGSTSVHCPSVSSNYKSVVKKVRFSISENSRPQNSVSQGQLSTLHAQPAESLESNESYHESHLEPVTETIFFTHSRYSYDRSPIAVDKVLNKSLDLPPRTPIDAFSAGRWLPKSRPAHHCDASGVPFHLALCDQAINCVPTENADELNFSTFSAAPRSITASQSSMNHSFPLIDSQMEGPECCDPEFIHPTCDCREGPNDPSGSLTAPRCCAIHNCRGGSSEKNELPDSNDTESLTMRRNSENEIEYHHQIPKNINNTSLIEDNLTCHSFSNLKLGENLDGTEACILEVDDIFGIGKWTRAQVFGSCDALDGF